MSAGAHESRFGRAVLQVLDEAAGPLTVRKISLAADVHRDFVAHALRSARRAGLADTVRVDGAVLWLITEAGRTYLAGLSARSP